MCVCVAVPPVIVKEWCSSKAKSALTPELVPALCFREWTCPNLRRLWLGRASEDRSRRTRAFLACLRSDCPALLNPAQVPQHLLLMCCVLRYVLECSLVIFLGSVSSHGASSSSSPLPSLFLDLRYIMQWPGGRILQRHELDAFLAQAVSNQLYEPDQLQELKVSPSSQHNPPVPGPRRFLHVCLCQVEKVDARGVQLASLFMAGVDTALFINDVCGQPLPWEHCCPWGFFDGKLFQSKLARAARDRSALLDMCEGQVRPDGSMFLLQKGAVNIMKNVAPVNLPDLRGGSLHSLQLTSPLCRRSWFPRWRRCARQSWRESTCPALLRLPLLFHLLPSCPPPWCRLSTPCLRSTRLVRWVACPRTTTRTIPTTLLSTDPEPFQVCSHSTFSLGFWGLH